MEKLLVIVGPTAVGKSNVALRLAEEYDGEIISADSVQVYRGLDLGAAKPSLAERATVAHHLIDIVDANDNYTVADFQQDAALVITDVLNRGKLPILVGGTGLYVRAILKGFAFSDSGADQEFRHKLQKAAELFGPEHVHQKLAAVDAQTASKLHPNDLRRVIRALEVFSQTQLPISEQVALTPESSVYDAAQIGLTMPRDLLYTRIEERVDKMIAQGLVDEVKCLLAQGVLPQAKSMQSLGYKQIVSYLQGDISLPTAVELIKRDTRRFAKRQVTWLRRDAEIQWVDVHKIGDVVDIVKNISLIVAGYWQ